MVLLFIAAREAAHRGDSHVLENLNSGLFRGSLFSRYNTTFDFLAANFRVIAHYQSLLRKQYPPVARRAAWWSSNGHGLPNAKAPSSSRRYRRRPRNKSQTIEQARIEVERENELECIREAAATLNREREDEALRIFDLKQAAVLAEHEKEELRRVCEYDGRVWRRPRSGGHRRSQVEADGPIPDLGTISAMSYSTLLRAGKGDAWGRAYSPFVILGTAMWHLPCFLSSSCFR